MSLFFKGEQRDAGVWYDATDNPQRVAVTEETAPRLAPVFAAHRYVIDYVSTLPVDAYRKDGATRVEMPSLPQLFASANDPGEIGLVAWLGQAVYGLMTGNAVGWILSTDGFGFPTKVAWLHWSQWAYDEYAKQWRVDGNPVPSSQIVHIPWIVPPGKRLGMSPIEYYAAVARAGMSAQDYGDVSANYPLAVFKNTVKEVTPEQSDQIRSRLASSMRRNMPLVTGNDWDFTPVSIPPNQAQFVETQKLTANQIASIYGVDPTEVGGTAANSLVYSTEELRQIRRAADNRPYYARLEHGFARILPAKQFMRFNLGAMLRVDAKTQAEVFEIERRMGTISRNEVRALNDREPIPGPEGDTFTPEQTMQPVARSAVEHE